MTIENYSIPAQLVQGTLNLLLELPAKQSRELINAYEQICRAQEKAADEKVEAERVAAALASATNAAGKAASDEGTHP